MSIVAPFRGYVSANAKPFKCGYCFKFTTAGSGGEQTVGTDQALRVTFVLWFRVDNWKLALFTLVVLDCPPCMRIVIVFAGSFVHKHNASTISFRM